MSKRLLAFGCSHTYGHGLVDCYNKKTGAAGEKPSKYAWPQLVADYYGFECINLSKPGASNKEIWWKITQQKYFSADTVVILWSYPHRSAMIRNENDIKQLGYGFEDQASKVFTSFISRVSTDYNFGVDGWMYIDFANRILRDSKVKKIYNFVINYQCYELVNANWITTNIISDAQEFILPVDLALDNNHAGPIANKKFADRVIDIFKGENNEYT